MRRKSKTLKGIAVSPGIAWSKVVFLEGTSKNIPRKKVAAREVEAELKRFEAAIIEAKKELGHIENRVKNEIDTETSGIFLSQSTMLEDPVFMSEIRAYIKKNRVNAEAAISAIVNKYGNMFLGINDLYIRGRSSDIIDIGNRLLNIMVSKEDLDKLKSKDYKGVIFGMEFMPSDIVKLNKKNVLGLISEIGGETSHAAIIAKSLNIPAVVAIKNATRNIKPNDVVLIDGYDGKIIVNPEEKIVEEYRSIKEKTKKHLKEFDRNIQLPAITKDGRRIKLLANMDSITDLHHIDKYGAEGIGLYRTEYLYMERDKFPPLDELTEAMEKVAREMNGRELNMRIIDVGGEKNIPYMKMPTEFNPALGWRGIRFLLQNQAILKMQLRTILRASAHGDVRILFPMISNVKEIKKVHSIIRKAKQELKEEGIPFNEHIKIGIMVETPSSAINIMDFIDYVDFINVGTNDLVQYLLAVDRSNPKVSRLYEPLDTSVLAILKSLAEICEEENKEMCICGEMAGNPNYTLLFVGLGVKRLSIAPMYVPMVKEVIRRMKYKTGLEIAEYAFKVRNPQTLRKYLVRRTSELIPYIEKILVSSK